MTKTRSARPLVRAALTALVVLGTAACATKPPAPAPAPAPVVKKG